MIRYSRVGKRVPLYCTAVGKILLGGLPDEEIIKALSKIEFNKLTPNTIDNLYELLKQVQNARALGYALDLEELELGLNCVAVPVYNYTGNVIAAISASGSASQFPAETIKGLVNSVQEAGRAISTSMGWLPEK
jgi:DNA-binding IclR family transcriptional regulator